MAQNSPESHDLSRAHDGRRIELSSRQFFA
jgi:hypothetical protein